jgi:hypothetical protein
MGKAIKDLSMKEYFNSTVRNKRLHDTDQPGSEDVDRGELSRHKFDNYYSISNVIAMAGPVDPQDFDSPVYNVEKVWANLEHNAQKLYILNDEPIGGVPLFVIVSHKSVMDFTTEMNIPPQEYLSYSNVYEIRLRSAKLGAKYRITEYMPGIL